MAEQILLAAIEWCSADTPVGVQLSRLWSPALLPKARGAGSNASLYSLASSAARDALVRAVTDQRATLLHANPTGPACPETELAGGRLLVYAPDDSLADGAARIASRGFFAEDNAPPWGTWLWYVVDNDRVRERERQIREHRGDLHWYPIPCISYLLSWVPPAWLKFVAAGISANPEGCIAWAHDALGVEDEAILARARKQTTDTAAVSRS